MQGEGKAKIVWVYALQTNRIIEHRRPDIVFLNITGYKCKIIDEVIRSDYNISTNQIEKISNYSDRKVYIDILQKMQEKKC